MTTPETVSIDLLAGRHPNGQPVIERLPAVKADTPNQFWLQQSPLFVPGLARGDRFELLRNTPGGFRVHTRSGNLAVRVFCRGDAAALSEELTPEVEKLGGTLDIATPRALAYSIHVAVGFSEIERVFDALVPSGSAQWAYGNVYDANGEPMHWWEEMLAPGIAEP